MCLSENSGLHLVLLLWQQLQLHIGVTAGHSRLLGWEVSAFHNGHHQGILVKVVSATHIKLEASIFYHDSAPCSESHQIGDSLNPTPVYWYHGNGKFILMYLLTYIPSFSPIKTKSSDILTWEALWESEVSAWTVNADVALIGLT